MKFNNKLNLVEYLQIIDEMVNEFFDLNTYEYTPHIGEIYSVCAYFNHCVVLEDGDEIQTHPITDIMDVQQLYDNEEFMKHYNDETYNFDNNYLTFGNAYYQALDIVEYKKRDANSFATAISSAIGAVLQSFKDSFSEDDIEKFVNIAKQISDGKISNEAIAAAYENSTRFQENTDKLNAPSVPVGIPLPQKK